MAKKITFAMLVLLIVSAFVFVSCDQEAAGGGGGNQPLPQPKAKVENKAGEVSENLVYNGDLESEDAPDLQGDGASILRTEGVGVNNSYALLVTQNENYGEVMVDFTDYYGRGKSYYVEASFKNVGGEGTNTDDLTAYLAFSLVAGQGYEATGRTYDVPGQYEGGWLSDDDAFEIFGIETNMAGEDISNGEWHTVAAIVDAEQIEELLKSETQLNGGSGDPTLHTFNIVFFVGTYSEDGPGQKGYVYYLDNVVIKDLNKELKREGRTYEAPDTGDDGEDDGEGDGEDDGGESGDE